MDIEELLRSARNLYENPGTNEALKVVLEETYTELKESDDERIRAVILKLVLGMRDEVFTTADKLVTKPKVLAYLEKQKERKPVERNEEDEKIRQALIRFFKNTHDWVNLKYDGDEIVAYLERQKEQKPAEVNVKALLAADRLASAEMTGRLKERSEIMDNPEKYGLQKPAEWSEEDEKMNEEIRQYLKQDRAEFPGRSARLNRMIGWLISLRPQLKYEWSEEDEVNLGDIKCALYDYYGEERAEELYNMLKSLHPQPREDTKCEPEEGDIVVNKDGVIAIFESWGHHPDGGSFNDHSYFFAKCTLDGDCYNEVDCHPDSWGIRYATPEEIRKLLPYLLVSYRPHWKPSEEQMEWLESAVKLSTDKPHIHGIIISLYEQLKKL